jgi:hypothetical protein
MAKSTIDTDSEKIIDMTVEENLHAFQTVNIELNGNHTSTLNSNENHENPLSTMIESKKIDGRRALFTLIYNQSAGSAADVCMYLQSADNIDLP